ncbi:hypothetical protein MUP77_13105 [Candidatus Bathyarchaeota archaeon]|nr:hypothetical protein [Candidatus Bathyarchaeota archaeon]
MARHNDLAAVAYTPSQAMEVAAGGAIVSKELGVPNIRDFAEDVKKISANYHVVVVCPKRFNELFNEARNEKNLNVR